MKSMTTQIRFTGSPHSLWLTWHRLALSPYILWGIMAAITISSLSTVEGKPKVNKPSVDYNIREDSLSMQEIDRAESLFFEGFVAYQQRKYEAAAEFFQKAYSIVPYHDLLYNVARSREQLGDKEGSIQWYRAYLATKPIDETTVIHRLKLLGGETTPKALEAEVEVDTTMREFAPLSIAPWISFGVGVVLAGVGTYYGLSALDEATAARDANTQSTWSARKAEAESSALIADVTYVLGTSAILAGVYLWILQDKQQGSRINGKTDVKESASVMTPLQLAVTPEGAHVGYSWSF